MVKDKYYYYSDENDFEDFDDFEKFYGLEQDEEETKELDFNRSEKKSVEYCFLDSEETEETDI